MTHTQTASNHVQLPAPGRYRLDPRGCEVRLGTRHLFGLAAVTGRMHVRGGVVEVETPVYDSIVRAELDAASFATGNPQRDRTVRGRRYLATERFPTISFHSTGVARTPAGWRVEGSLRVRDTSYPLHLQVAEQSLTHSGAGSFTLEATGRVDRYAVGVSTARGLASRYLDVAVRILAVTR